MKKKATFYKTAAVAFVCTTFLYGCSNNSTSTDISSTNSLSEAAEVMSAEEISKKISELVTYDQADQYSDWENENPTQIDLSGNDAIFDAQAAVIFQENILTIKAGGTYVLNGQLNDGQIVVDAEDKKTVRLVLNGVDINNSDGAAIYVAKAEKAVVSLVEGTDNTVSDGKVYAETSEDDPNAAIFSKSDLSINGLGKLIVNGNYNNGITSKDELKITGGNIQIQAVDDGIMGRDLVAVKEAGKMTIAAGGDGVKSSNDKDSTKGNIVLEGGTFDITAQKDGVQAITSLWITDGNYTIVSGGGSPEMISSNSERMGGMRGNNSTTTSTESSETESTNGLKAAADLVIGGGTINIDSADDAVHSNGHVIVAGGDLQLASGDDGIHGDTSVGTSGGKIMIAKSYEGMESQLITIASGDISVNSSDDGINIGGGNDGSGMDMQSTSDGQITISGGNIAVNANGDGLDSNGSILMTDGTVIVNGPTTNGNGSLDYNGTYDLSGGLLIAVGSSGMAQAPSEQSTQNSILMSFSEVQGAETIFNLQDEDGKSLVTFKPSKEFQSVVISSPDLEKDSTYTLYSGGKTTGSESNGLYISGDYQGGAKIVEFTISDSVTWLNESGVTEAGSSGPSGGQNRPDRGAQRPN